MTHSRNIYEAFSSFFVQYCILIVSQKRVRKRLKKYYPKDFQDTTWTVAVQWNHAKYEVQTTKVRVRQSISAKV